MSDVALRLLVPGDEAALERFLAPRWETSMFLRSNVRAAGLVDRGQPRECTYCAAFRDGEIMSLAAQSWTGMVLLQAPEPALLPGVAQAAVATSRRPVIGLSGPRAQVVAARAALGLADRRASMDSVDDLFTLSLSELRLPPALSDGTWRCRPPRPEERDRLADWRAAYHVETLGMTPGPDVDEVRRHFAIDPVQRVLVVDGEVVAYATFNAQLPEAVQVGGVFTPPALRGRGYGRAVVAGALRDARANGVAVALLFTGEENVAARRAYLGLGFAIIGDYSLVLFS
jgi:ribosomal protein S18 acetylase RimI-like enzyme